MATLPTVASLTGATTTNAQQKTNLTALQTFLSDLLGTDSGNKAAARAALGVQSAADYVSAFSGNGYVKIPTTSGSLIIQWGTVSVTAINGNITAGNYPIAFPSTCIAVFGGTDTAVAGAVIVTKAGGNPTGQMVFTNFHSAAVTGKFLAFGY